MAQAQEHDRRDSERKCIATGEICSPDLLVRFVLDPDGVVTPDLAARLPGRGAWTLASRDAVIDAASKGLFARAFKRPAQLPANVTAEDFSRAVEAGIAQKALSALGLARRAGKAHLGFDQAADARRAGKVAALIVASNASRDVAAKLTRLAANIATVTVFDTEALSPALGRENVTYAALSEGPEATRFLREAVRLAGFRGGFAPAGVERAELV